MNILGKLKELEQIVESWGDKPSVTGYVPEKIDPKDAIYEQVFGGVKKFSGTPRSYLQCAVAVDEQGALPICVTESRLHIAEIEAISNGFIIKFSRWLLSVLSGTTKDGNSLNAVDEYFRVTGNVLDAICHLPDEIKAGGLNRWTDFQNLPQIPADADRYFGGNHSWVLGGIEAMKDALQYSPLQIAVGIGDTWNNTIVQNPSSITAWHSVAVLEISDYIYILDSLSGNHIKKLSLNYSIPYCKSFRDLPQNWRSINMLPSPIQRPAPTEPEQYIPAANDSGIVLRLENQDTLHTLIAAGHLPGVADPAHVITNGILLIAKES